MPADPARVLAVHPAGPGFGFAVVEDADALVDWGLKHVHRGTPATLAARLTELITRWRPVVIVVEDVIGTRRGKHARSCVEVTFGLASLYEIAVAQIERAEVQQRFARIGTTRHEIAVHLASRFAGLARHLPRQRKLWMSEDRRLAIFSAVALALVVTHQRRPRAA